MSDPVVLALADCQDIRLVGGKAMNLCRLIRAGFQVPEGFVVTTAGFRANSDGHWDEVLKNQILESYRALGSPMVAVRSSATAEDMAEASMAGQYETFLNIQGEAAVCDAVARCWKSLNSERTRCYLEKHGIPLDQVAMAVVVQRLVPADLAGVMFTANPRTGSREELVIDASYGLGESVVSGLVQPDSLILDRATGRVKLSVCGSKETLLRPGAEHMEPVPEELRARHCLNSQQVYALWNLGWKLMEHFGSAQDAEWAIQGDNLYLLQSRAITTLEDIEERAGTIQREREKLKLALAENLGPWVRHNISETLPHPTPLTWGVVRRFMSGNGGFGLMYRMVGFDPSPGVRESGFLELIAGRPYMDLSRAPGMFFEPMPFRYDIDLLRINPDAAQGPPTLPAGSIIERGKTASRLAKTACLLREMASGFDHKLLQEIIPSFLDWVRGEKARPLESLTVREWIECWSDRERKVMDEFAPNSLLPSLLTAMTLDDLRQCCAEHFWDDDSEALATRLATSPEPDSTVRSAQGLWELAKQPERLPSWLEEFGHRAPEEFDLATARWRERPEAVLQMAARMLGGESPLARHAAHASEAKGLETELADRLPPKAAETFRAKVASAKRFVRFREDGKFFLMHGYDLLRDLAVEAGRRLGIGERVFLLDFEELRDALLTGFAPLHLLDRRQAIRAAENRLHLPHVIESGDIETLGEPPVIEGGDQFAAFSISSGHSEGPARIVHSPTEAGNLGEGYILVCPSTDPNWTPLFVKASGLIIERGGTLSHGAVVAREMGLPAVVLDGATRMFAEGEILRLDAQSGAVYRGDAPTLVREVAAPEDKTIPVAWRPPPPGRIEHWSARVRNGWAIAWAVFLAGIFLCPPSWLMDPTLQLFDAALWPLVSALGKPWTVAIIAIGLAAISMIGQRLLTDNRRLLEAKKRAAILRREAQSLPEGSPRQKTFLRAAAPVSTRILMASFVPLAVILGPMVMLFFWLPSRVDPASANARPASDVMVIATVRGDFLSPVEMLADPRLQLVQGQSTSQSLPPIRPTLEKLLSRWKASDASDASGLPWEVVAAGARTKEEMLSSLEAFLAAPMPDRDLSWILKSPPDVEDRFSIAVRPQEGVAVETSAVLGNRFAPEKREATDRGPQQMVRGAADSSILSLRLQYSGKKIKGDDVFLRPMEFLGWKWDSGWLLVYIAVYLPAMMLFRWVLRIP